jgi:hypothetical protein
MDTPKRFYLPSVSIFVFLLLWVTSCNGKLTMQEVPAPTELLPTPAILSQPQATSASTPACTNNLTFLYDMTIPDGTFIQPNAPIDKQWLVQNSGSCNWDRRYRLRLVSGDPLGAPIEQALYPARPGTQASIRVMFRAPENPGAYTSEWQAFDPSGIPFGNSFFIKIVVSP